MIIKRHNSFLYSSIKKYKTNNEGIFWLVKHVKEWTKLQQIKQNEKKIALILANYPIRNGRIANGVGLDTPESTIQILNWLKSTGINLGVYNNDITSHQLINKLLSGRTNDPESFSKKPLDFLPLQLYQDQKL